MCMDYRDLNKVSPEDDLPLPHIYVLVDNTSQFSVFSLMNGFSGYNCIKMSPNDMEKKYLYHPVGDILLQSHAFWFEKCRETYKRAMVTFFHDMKHKEIEVYVDDMISKSRVEDKYIIHLRKLFARLRKYKLRLNPAKCTFRVRSVIARL